MQNRKSNLFRISTYLQYLFSRRGLFRKKLEIYLTSKSHWNRPPPLTLMGWICSWLHVICSTGNLNHCVASSIRKVCPQQLIART